MLLDEIVTKLEKYFMLEPRELSSKIKQQLVFLALKLEDGRQDVLTDWIVQVEKMLYEHKIDRRAMQLRVAKHVLRYPQRYDEAHDFGDKNSLAAKVCCLYNIPWEISTLRAWGFVFLPDFFHLFYSYDNAKNLAWLKEYVKQNEKL